MSSQTTKSNIAKMITDSVIDDFAAVGRLKGEARESKAGREGGREEFYQLLRDNLKAAI